MFRLITLAVPEGTGPDLPFLILIPSAKETPMRKLKLDLDALDVETFETAADERARGTVQAHDNSEFPCTWDTCRDSCGWSDIDCHAEECTTDWITCMDLGSCCPAVCW
jgi:hypothetical protein